VARLGEVQSSLPAVSDRVGALDSPPGAPRKRFFSKKFQAAFAQAIAQIEALQKAYLSPVKI
jgi:hypothetical protein